MSHRLRLASRARACIVRAMMKTLKVTALVLVSVAIIALFVSIVMPVAIADGTPGVGVAFVLGFSVPLILFVLGLAIS